MRRALRLARRGYGQTSPNPMVGAVLVKNGRIIGRGWHRRAGQAHAEVEAICDAESRHQSTQGATLYVTLEPCSTVGRTPACTEAIKAAGIKRLVVAAADPNPAHAGRAFRILKQTGIEVVHGVLAAEANRLNAAFNHWIVQRTPFVTVKTAMTLDGKLATASGQSKWITGKPARSHSMKLRQGADAILVGVNTVRADDPSLTVRRSPGSKSDVQSSKLRRIILDSNARTPRSASIITDDSSHLTTVVVAKTAPRNRVAALRRRVRVIIAPLRSGRIDLRWLLKKLGRENVTSLLVEGGGEVNASVLLGGFAHRIVFFYAPKIMRGRDSRKALEGAGVTRLADALALRDIQWRRLGEDLLLTARVT
jgi:diaminohydroxyphosphoribosylaminopyrimidine deaminase/5-amino-6-(5-phosphoribosylamino)uracil reductase